MHEQAMAALWQENKLQSTAEACYFGGLEEKGDELMFWYGVKAKAEELRMEQVTSYQIRVL
jgi:hypothetical protein